jgi:adenylate cyclase
MSLAEEQEAWLEQEGKQYALQRNCSVGRAPLNTVVLDSPRVSRLHAILHSERGGAFWLVDLGSSNGTFLNSRRIHEPIRIRNGDRITIGASTFTFRQSRSPSRTPKGTVPPVTFKEATEDIPCWLLVADIKSFTSLSRNLPSDKLARLVGSWLATCKEIIEKHNGILNKYLGDGILAYWRDGESAAENILRVIAALKQAQTHEPEFRFVVHFGSVAIGGISSVREETIMGSEVNLVFRLEKLVASLGEGCGLSSAARAKLGELIAARYLGDYELKGFEGRRAFFAM